MNIKKTLLATATTSLLFTTNAQAFEVFKGEDINYGGLNTHATLNQTKQAEQQLLNRLDNTVGTENFENINPTTSSNFNLSFPGAGTASLSGDNAISDINNTSSSQILYELEQGLYPSSGSQYLYTKATAQNNNTFSINFSEDVSAFGFYAYDLGDWGAQLTLKLYYKDQLIETIDNLHTIKTDGSTTGSAIYVGIIGEVISNGNYQAFDRVDFTIAGNGILTNPVDGFAFDDMTIGTVAQLVETTTTQQLVNTAD